VDVYKRHGETIRNYNSNTVLPTLCLKREHGGALFLRELETRWINHRIMNDWLQRFFSPLERYYVKQNRLPSLKQVGFTRFREDVYEQTKSDVAQAILDLINDDRGNCIIDNGLLKSVIAIYGAMSTETVDPYLVDFEPRLEASTREYYARKRHEWITDSTPEYLLKVESALESEKIRVRSYLKSSTDKMLSSFLDEEIPILRESEKSDLVALLNNDRNDDLRRMFRLFSRLDNGALPIANTFRQFVADQGLAIIGQRSARINDGETETNDDSFFVKSLIKLHEKHLGTVKNVFDAHSAFRRALPEAFSSIMNENVGLYTNAELLATFCDRILRPGSGEKCSDAEVEVQLERVLQLFAYLLDKDVFAESYRNLLAKRLLSQRFSSYDLEKLMISKLKIHCGPQFTSAMEVMLADLAVGAEQRPEFEQHLKTKAVKLDFQVELLTQGIWPTYPRCEPQVTPAMVECKNVFCMWIVHKYPNQKLDWIPSQGSATVRGSFKNGIYDFQVSTLQALALSALSEGRSLSLNELVQQLNLEEKIVKPILHSLCSRKINVLVKSPAGNKIAGTDKFSANAKFTSTKRKIRVPSPSIESIYNREKVELDRSYAIEAAIVRIMKARKTLQHQALLSEVMAQLFFFSPDAHAIKRCIEKLIDKEYLERSTEQSDVYNYLA
jgi:cullin 1